MPLDAQQIDPATWRTILESNWQSLCFYFYFVFRTWTRTRECRVSMLHCSRWCIMLPFFRDLMKAVAREINTGQLHHATQTVVRVGLAPQIRLQRRFKNIMLLGGVEQKVERSRTEIENLKHTYIKHLADKHHTLETWKWLKRSKISTFQVVKMNL